MNKITIVLPFKLPTWNALLNMSGFERNRISKFLHNAVSMCIPKESDLPTLTASARKPLLTDLEIQAYYEMIVPSRSKKYRSRKKQEAKMKQRSR